MITKFLLQKRRILLGIAGGTLAAEFMFGASGGLAEITFIERIVFFAALVSVITVAYVALALKFTQQGEKLVETMILPAISGALVLRHLPAGDYLLNHPVAFVVTGLGGIALSYTLLYGRLLDALTRMDSPVISAQFQIKAPADLLWRMLVPAPGHEKDFVFPETKFLSEPDAPDDEWISIFGKPKSTPAISKITRIRVQEIEPGSYFRFSFQPADSPSRSTDHHGWYAITITPVGDGIHTVKIEVRTLNISLSDSLQPMLSNHFEAHLNQTISAIEARMRVEAKRSGLPTSDTKVKGRTRGAHQKPKDPPEKPKRSLTV